MGRAGSARAMMRSPTEIQRPHSPAGSVHHSRHEGAAERGSDRRGRRTEAGPSRARVGDAVRAQALGQIVGRSPEKSSTARVHVDERGGECFPVCWNCLDVWDGGSSYVHI